MMISLIKKQKGHEFVKDMEEKYGTLEKIKKDFEQLHNMKLLVDIENWEYYNDNPEETIELSENLVTDDIELSKQDLKILNIIKHYNPKSIHEVADLLNSSVDSIQSRLKKLEESGLIHFTKENKNSLKPYLGYDEIKITI